MSSRAAATTSLLEREIRAQPEALSRFCEHEAAATAELGARLAQSAPAGLLIAARGSSDHAAVYAKYLFGIRLGLPVALAAPSIFTAYASAPRLRGWTVLAISQSGASPDVVEVIAAARAQGCATAAITDDTGSDLARTAQHVIPLRLGGERSVAATGSFTTTLLALACLARGWSRADSSELGSPALAAIGDRVESVLARDEPARAIGATLAGSEICTVIGRGFGFAVALEIALKLKEVAGLFAEPFSAADYRHGPIALASASLRALVIELAGPVREDVAALARELEARGVHCACISDAGDAALRLPAGPEWLAPIPAVVAGQLVALEAARLRGRDPDHPVGLSKVTRTR